LREEEGRRAEGMGHAFSSLLFSSLLSLSSLSLPSFSDLEHAQQADIRRPLQGQQDVPLRPEVGDLAVADEVGLGEGF